MEVSITEFRRELFHLVGRAMAGDQVWVAHKGKRFRVAPEDGGVSRLSRITQLQIVDPETPASMDISLREEMTRAWESDWTSL